MELVPATFYPPQPPGPLGLVIFAVSAVALAACALHPAGASLDLRLFAAINGRRLPRAIEIGVRLVSHLGLMPVHALFFLWVALQREVLGLGHPREGWPWLVGLLFVWALCRLTKRRFGRPRPHAALPDARLIGRAPSGSSFPSSHTALMTYTAVILTSDWPGEPFLAAVWILVAAVAVARVYLGVHYPRDILGGITLGSFGACVTMWVGYWFLR